MNNTFKLLILSAAMSLPSALMAQQNPQPQAQEAQPCKPAPKTPDIVNRQVAKQSSKWGRVFNRAIVKATGGIADASDIPAVKLSTPKPCPVQPSTPAPPAPAAPAPAK